MYMAPIQRNKGRPRESGGVRFLFGISAFLGVFAGVGYIFLVGQGSPEYQVQASLDSAGRFQAAITRTRATGTHALWVDPKTVNGRQASSIAKPAPETMVKPSQVDRIAPGGLGQKPAAKTSPKAAPRAVAQLPTRRPTRVWTKRKPPVAHHARARKTHSVAQASTADMIGPYRIQVGSFRTPEAAQDRWLNLRQRHRDLLGSYIMVIEKVNRGRRGVVYRLQAGPLKTRSAVTRVCSRLSKRRIGCSLVDG
jgi:hypothetical protein